MLTVLRRRSQTLLRGLETAATRDMFVADLEGAEPVAERVKRWGITKETDDVIQRAEGNPNAIVYGTSIGIPMTKPDICFVDEAAPQS
jgi:hypothetical protein